ncbi:MULTISPECIES: LysR family transcriptional regulator [unclassified Cupriavidus]|uniref:LysR family transcriptional regulator n=1 Tax=Cupriavidus sp. H19C3 TaxID=3241603 RepID=UPI003BF77393
MDKLRAMQFFIAAAQGHSFTQAARQLNVSVPAITRMIGELERSLGVSLFDRSAQGVALTADGASYLEACTPLLERLALAEEALRGAASRPHGTLVVGAPPIISQHCILPALQEFHARYPDIQIDVRTVDRIHAPEASAAEIMVLYGWPQQPGMVQRHLADTRLLICASPAYWASRGMPESIAELKHHACLLFRDQEGTVMDYWEHERNGVKQAVAVGGWLISSHRDVVLDAAIAGMGVGRFTDLTIREPLAKGLLVPAFAGWETTQSPPIQVMYRSSQRRLPRIRAFIEFLTELFARLESQRPPGLAIHVDAERPHWYRRRHSRASATPTTTTEAKPVRGGSR